MPFVEVVDFFIKLHHLFNFEFAKEFSSLMHFFEYTLYDFEQSKRLLTPRILEVAKEVKTTVYQKEKTSEIDGASEVAEAC